MIVPRTAAHFPRRGAGPVSRTAGPGRAAPPTQLRAALDPLIKADDPANAELLCIQAAPLLSLEARAEAAQRVAWAYYADGRDADARRVADTWRVGASGDWAAQAAWISGLASWRLRAIAKRRRAHFARSPRSPASASSTPALIIGPRARSRRAGGRRSVAPLLKAAARSNESFYGLLARETLGMDTRLPRNRTVSTRRSKACPTSAGRSSWSRSASARWPRKCFATRRGSAGRPITMA